MKRFIMYLTSFLILSGMFWLSTVPNFADGGGSVIEKPKFIITVDKGNDQETIFRIKKEYEDTSVDTRDPDFKARAVGFDYELKALSVESMAAQGKPETVVNGHTEIPAGSDYVDIDVKKLINTEKIKSDIGLTVYLVIDEKSLKGANGVINSDNPVPLFSGKMAGYMEQAQKAAEKFKADGNTDIGSIAGLAGEVSDQSGDTSGQADAASIIRNITSSGPKGIMNFLNIGLKFVVIAVLVFLAVVILGCFAIAKSHNKQKKG